MIVLFVCHANLNRSPRAAEVFRKFASQKSFDVEVQSAGTNAPFDPRDLDPDFLRANYGVESVTRLTDEMLEKADMVVALDGWVRWEIQTGYQVIPKRIITLGVEDRYSLRLGNLDELYRILNQKLEPLAEELFGLEGRRPSKEAF